MVVQLEKTGWDKVCEWLDANEAKLITKEYRYAVTYGFIGGEPWVDFDPEAVEGLAVGEDSISFGYGNAWCVWTASDRPQDKFGSTYISYEDGIELADGCFQVGYADDQYTECDLSIEFEDECWQEFLEWCKENTDNVSSLGESGESSGCAWSVTYWTANIPPNSHQWMDLFNKYCGLVGE